MIELFAALLLLLHTGPELARVPTCQPPGVLSKEICATAAALVPGLLPAEVNARTGNDASPTFLLLPRGFAFDYVFVLSRGSRTATLTVRCTFSEGMLVEARDLPEARNEIQLVSQEQASQIVVGQTYSEVAARLCAPGWVIPSERGGFIAVYHVTVLDPQGMRYPALKIGFDDAGIVVWVGIVA
ncbi:hypothetical protein EG835_10155 [bacterium]|nr:hypothetical protein [bacterium]